MNLHARPTPAGFSRRSFLGVGASLAGATLLSACGGGSASGGGGATLKFWTCRGDRRTTRRPRRSSPRGISPRAAFPA